jgi:hypothetical protein
MDVNVGHPLMTLFIDKRNANVRIPRLPIL